MNTAWFALRDAIDDLYEAVIDAIPPLPDLAFLVVVNVFVLNFPSGPTEHPMLFPRDEMLISLGATPSGIKTTPSRTFGSSQRAGRLKSNSWGASVGSIQYGPSDSPVFQHVRTYQPARSILNSCSEVVGTAPRLKDAVSSAKVLPPMPTHRPNIEGPIGQSSTSSTPAGSTGRSSILTGHTRAPLEILAMTTPRSGTSGGVVRVA